MNPRIAEPRSPGPWVDQDECACGARYADHRSPHGWNEAIEVIRRAAETAGDAGGGWSSRGPVLWALRCLKLGDWYATHHGCREESAPTGKAPCRGCGTPCPWCQQDAA